MQKLKIFLDSNMLDPEKFQIMESMNYDFEYFYPNIDKYLLKERDIPKVMENAQRNDFKYIYSYSLKWDIDFIRKDPVLRKKFFLIMRPDQEHMFNQTFTKNGPVKIDDGTKLKISAKHLRLYNKYLNELKEIYPNWNSSTNFKDLVLLAIVLFVNNNYEFIYVLEENGYTLYFDENRPKVENQNGKKYLISNDHHGLFSTTTINILEEKYPSLKIFHWEDFPQEIRI